jgi:hypothetical protein
MKLLLLNILTLVSLVSYGQTSISEIADKKIQQRVLLVKSRTDSFLNKATSKVVFKRLVPDFGVTYQVGEFYQNYLFLNKYETDPDNIYDLSQYYTINDTTLGVSDTIGIYYLEIKNQFASETYKLEVRFKSNDDYLKVKALNYLYQAATQQKLKQLIANKKLKVPFIKISVDGKSNTYFVFLKDKNMPHNFVL